MAYKYSYTNQCNETTTVRVRNVASKNPKDALQFEIDQDKGKRTMLWTFDLPASEISTFIEAIQKED